MEKNLIVSENIPHLNDNQIAEYLDYLLKNKDHIDNDILEHVEDCLDCKTSIMSLYDLASSINESVDSSKEESEEFIHKGTRTLYQSNTFKIAAIFVFVIFSAYMIRLIYTASWKHNYNKENQKLALNTPKKDQVSELNYENTSNNPVQNKSNEDAYIASPTLDNFIESSFRSTSIKVTSPEKNKVFKTGMPVIFSYSGQLKEPVFIEVLNNKEKKVIKSEIFNNTFTLLSKLSPGLYYYKIESADDIVFVGKFIVK